MSGRVSEVVVTTLLWMGVTARGYSKKVVRVIRRILIPPASEGCILFYD
jgi:hypothetical protein